MTEAEWKVCSDPIAMLDLILGEAGERKLRLFAVACCHSVGNLLNDEHFHRAVELAERHADGLAREKEINAVRNSSRSTYPVLLESPIDAARSTVEACVRAARIAAWEPLLFPKQFPEDTGAASSDQFEGAAAVADTAGKRESSAQAVLLRDIFGNPFRPVTFDPTWITPNTVALAKSVYLCRAFDRMGILGDALRDAGCDDAGILDHCGSQTEHVRGCWVVDSVLGRTSGGGMSSSRTLGLSIQNASTTLRIVMLEPWGNEFLLTVNEKLEVTARARSADADLRLVESDFRTLVFVEGCSEVCVIKDGVTTNLDLESIAATTAPPNLPRSRTRDPMWDRDLDG